MNINNFCKQYFPIWRIRLIFLCKQILLKFFPVYYTKYLYKKIFNKTLNLNNPEDLNEKIQWLKLYSDTSKWPNLADKYKVREYIIQQGLGNMLNELYGVWKSPEEIDFSKLPKSFVLKTNNGSGDVIIVKDKSQINQELVKQTLQENLNRRFGIHSAEPHYLKIEPRIICEKLLAEEHPEISSSLIDYKFYCSFGNILCLMVCYDREIGVHAEKVIYDFQMWQPHWEWIKDEYKSSDSKKIVPKPKSLLQMLDAAKTLSKEFPLVRVDFYEIDGKAIFGELTFTSDAGFIQYLTDDFLQYIGKMIHLPIKK